MELIEPIHAKVIWTLVGGSNILDIFFDIDSSRICLDTDHTEFDTRYDKSNSEILKSQFQTINLIRHED